MRMKRIAFVATISVVALVLCGCPREADVVVGGVSSGGSNEAVPTLPFDQLARFAEGDSRYHVTQDFTLSLDNGGWTSSHPDVVTVDTSGKATIKGYSDGLYSRDVTLSNGRESHTITVRYPLPAGGNGVGYDKLMLHGKFRSYRPDTTKGDSMTHWCTGELLNDGSTCADCQNDERRIPEGAIVNGVEYPTYWSRLPLSIHADNHDTTRGLYAIQDKGTSAIFPNNERGLGKRADNNMRQCTAGVYIAFETNGKTIALDAEYLHSSSTSVTNGRAFSGLDLYVYEGDKWVHKHTFKDGDTNAALDVSCGLEGEKTRCILMLPTYNGFKVGNGGNPSGLKLTFGEGSTTYEIDPFGENTRKPILIYGTSITQGDGASGLRPGATYAAQIMWATGREVINMGVAGSAQMEYKMADFLSQIESEVFVIDPGWNLTAGGGGGAVTAASCTANGDAANITNEEVIKRAKYMVTTYRSKHPNTPIIMCPNYLKSSDNKTTEWQDTWATVEKPADFTNEKGYYYGRPGLLLYAAFLELRSEGVRNLYWAEQGLTADNSEYLDGSNLHPGITGMTDIANWVLAAISDAAPHLYTGGEIQVPGLSP